MARSKKINQPTGVQTGKTDNCGKQSDTIKKSAPKVIKPK